nr:hypothetical protein [Rhodococcus spelaei]
MFAPFELLALVPEPDLGEHVERLHECRCVVVGQHPGRGRRPRPRGGRCVRQSASGRANLGREASAPGSFSLAEHERFLADNADSIAGFRATQVAAFAAERDAWAMAGEFAKSAGSEAA